MARILVVDDEPKMTSLVCGQLEDAGHKVTTTVDPKEALALIEKHSFDLIITDLSMPEISGMQILEAGLEKEGTDLIMMTAYGTVETAVEAMKKGASDYLVKPFSLDELELTVARLIKQQKERSLSRHYRDEVETSRYGKFIGSAPATEEIKRMIGQVAGTDSTVLLTGRSGTGKELAARMVHDLSKRKEAPFIAVNCAALPDNLLESELFGHEKGAFTGAIARKHGRFELAHHGTIFLDEIGETAPSMQTKLLRVLEERSLVRVGGVDLIDVDVRVIAATNKDLKKEMEQRNFREDLFYRLNVFPIRLPQLVERKEDIVELADHFLKSSNHPHPTLPPEVANLLTRYDWPGNIRELKNVLERAVILAGGEELSVADFSLEIDSDPLVDTGSARGSAREGLEMAEKQMIIDALERTNGNKTEAANLLKITRRRLYSRMKVHNISV
ncbi:MAG: sigma-54 dependent transcriptional regulator [bacterium]|nr:sigma-54 dependent transcriptional regulator [bacterium]